MKFKNAPLIELIAELRWGAPTVVFPSPSSQTHANLSTEVDSLANNFARLVGSAGYTLAERLIPFGAPQMPFQPTHRFRRADTAQGMSLFSLGAGLFSANITPPYQTWEAFRPVVALGVDALLKSRTGDAVNQAFATVSLRYVNAFHANLTGGQSAVEFMEMLGIRLSLPSALEGRIDQSRKTKPMLLLSVPIDGNRTMNLNVGDATVNGQEAVLMDNMVSSRELVAPTVESVMTEFDAARAVIHDVFVQSTRPIADLLQPISGTD
ncbi:TIGR04255 family protein [Paraburkholderia strydomiana]|uniref:TIGR04255 family protein n=1 Tax=Paraburkholderia strydomiana TaxID=1245417 RepID=UPI0038BBC364